MIFQQCDVCRGTGRGTYGRPCLWCGGVKVRAVATAALTWPSEPAVDGPEDYTYDRVRDQAVGL